jgi:hypothetical protein
MTAGQRPELVEKKVLREYGPAMALLARFTGPENVSDQLGLETDVRTIIRQQIIKQCTTHLHRWRYEKRSVLIVWAILKVVKQREKIII